MTESCQTSSKLETRNSCCLSDDSINDAEEIHETSTNPSCKHSIAFNHRKENIKEYPIQAKMNTRTHEKYMPL